MSDGLAKKTQRTRAAQERKKPAASPLGTALALIGVGAIGTALYLQHGVLRELEEYAKPAATRAQTEAEALHSIKRDLTGLRSDVDALRGQLAGYVARDMARPLNGDPAAIPLLPEGMEREDAAPKESASDSQALHAALQALREEVRALREALEASAKSSDAQSDRSDSPSEEAQE